MSWASITYTFSPSTLIKSSEVNQNFADCVANANKGMPSGGIILWSGEIVNIPAGWFLCDGNNGTPNLVGKFIQGAGSGFAVGSTGGSATMSHTHTMAHTHSYDHVHYVDAYIYAWNVGDYDDSVADGSDKTPAGSDHQHHWTGNTASLNSTYGYAVQTGGASNATTSDGSNVENRPPFYTLAYIMKS